RASRVPASRRQSPRMCRPCVLEALEERTLLSTYTVQSLDDSGVNTLRWAIDQANQHAGADTIDFAVTGTVLLASALADLSDPTGLTDIEGPGAANLTVSRNSATGTPEFRIFTVQTSGEVRISGLTITGGKANDGGGIANSGTLTVTDSILTS